MSSVPMAHKHPQKWRDKEHKDQNNGEKSRDSAKYNHSELFRSAQ